MLRLLFELPLILIKFVLNIIFLIPMLVYKILINHKASVFIFSGNGENKERSKDKKTSRKKKLKESDVLKDINEEIQHQKLHGTPRYVTSPKKSSFGLKLAALLVIIIIILAFVFMGVHP